MASRFRRNNSARISFFAFQDIITSVSGILILVTLILATEIDTATDAAAESQPELEMRLTQLLEQQATLDLLNQQLRESLAALNAAPERDQLEADLRTLRERLAATAQRLTNAIAIERAQREEQAARDERLGLAAFSAELRDIAKQAESLRTQVAQARQQMAEAEVAVKRAENLVLKARARAGQLWVIPDDRSTTKEPLLVTVSAAQVSVDRFDQPGKRLLLPDGEMSSGFRRFLSGVSKDDQYIVFLVRPSGIQRFNELAALARAARIEIGYDALEENVPVNYSKPPPLEMDVTLPVIPRDSAPLASTNKGATAARSTVPATSAGPSPPSAAATGVPPAQPPPRESWWRRLLKAFGLA